MSEDKIHRFATTNRDDHWTIEEYRYYLQTGRIPAGKDRAPVQTTNVERHIELESPKADAGKEVHSKFRIRVHSRRRRLTDPSGVNDKWAIDGLVEGGLLPDDSAGYVEAVTNSQEKSKVEETVIEVWQLSGEHNINEIK